MNCRFDLDDYIINAMALANFNITTVNGPFKCDKGKAAALLRLMIEHDLKMKQFRDYANDHLAILST